MSDCEVTAMEEWMAQPDNREEVTMDTSIEYIKMCHCHEIQVLKHYSPHMWTNPISLRKGLYIDREGSLWHICQQIQAYLPRLDELINMVDNYSYIKIERKGGDWSIQGFVRRFTGKDSNDAFVEKDSEVLCEDFWDNDTPEKALLRLIMWQKHNQLWNGEKWT